MANIKISELNPSGDNVSADNSDFLNKLDDVIVQNIVGGYGGCKHYLKKCYGQKNLGLGYGGYSGYSGGIF